MKLEDWLKKEKWTVRTLATTLGVSTSYIYNIMKHNYQPSYDLAKAIQDFSAGEVTVEELRDSPKLKCPSCGRLTKREEK